MTEAEQFALDHGLSLDEAEFLLARRQRQLNPAKLGASTDRLKRALDILEAAQKKVGVHPVVVQDGSLEKSFDQVAAENLDRFYSTKDDRPKRRVNQPPVAVEDVSQDPEDY